MKSSHPRAGATVLIVLFLAGISLANRLDAGPLPRLVISLRSRADGLSFRESCAALRDAATVVPAGTVFTDGSGPSAEDLERARQVLEVLPPGSNVLLHLQIEEAATALVAEDVLESRLSAAVAALPLTAATGLVVEVGRPAGDDRLHRFTVATLAVKAKGANPRLSVTMSFPFGVSRSLAEFVRQTAVHGDAVAVSNDQGWREDAVWIDRTLHKAVVLRLATGASDDQGEIARAYLDALIDADDLAIDGIWADGISASGWRGLCSCASALGMALPDAFTAATVAAMPVSVTVDDSPAPAERAYLDTRSANVSMLIRTGATQDRPRTLAVTARSEKRYEIGCSDALDGHPLPGVTGPQPGAVPVRACTVTTSHALVTVRWSGAEERVSNVVNVTGRAQLRVEEVVARWQEARAAEEQAFQNATVSCLLSLHFEPAGLGGGFDVALELRQFRDRSGVKDWVQTGFFVNGVRLKDRQAFPLPQLEPKRVVSQPLELRIHEKYDYSLAGTDTVDGVLCYVVRVAPKESNEALLGGKVWIDGVRFRTVRAELEQRGGRSNVVSHAEIQQFQVAADRSGREFTVMRRIYVQEMLNAAGRTFLLEKTYDFSNYRLNTDDFASVLADARASADPMYRDTAEGLRRLRKEGTERVVEVSDSNRVRALVVGAMYDGTFELPIPIAGFSLVNFDFRKTGNQLSMFFAGPFLAADLSRQLNSRFRVGLDTALSAVPQRNRVFVGDQEVKALELWKFDETVGGLASWQAHPNLSLTAFSHLTFSLFRKTDETAPEYQVPTQAFTIENAGEAKFAARGYGVTANILRGDRVGWGPVGFPDATREVQPAYLKYSAEFGKQRYVGRFTKLALSLAYYGGHDLDRFSRYQPSFLTRPRIRGIPSGTDSFDAVGIAGLSYGLNVMELVKFEGGYSHAWGRNLLESERFRNYDGIELDVGTSFPWRTFLQGTISYALQGNTARYQSRWSIYVMLFRPLDR